MLYLRHWEGLQRYHEPALSSSAECSSLARLQETLCKSVGVLTALLDQLHHSNVVKEDGSATWLRAESLVPPARLRGAVHIGAAGCQYRPDKVSYCRGEQQLLVARSQQLQGGDTSGG